MKKVLLVFIIAALTLRLPAQTNPPARLALISESAEASTVADVLTAELSSRKNLQLLERNEIEKIYREQGLSAGNKDYLKLGQMLGADGLLLLDTAKEGTNQFLNVRLVAVKPGVVLVAEKFSWPMTKLMEWAPTFARHLDLLLPKLTVLVKDAIPLSVVNLRSATGSADALETERQLKLLTIQRLGREPRFFVLERQRMQLMTIEKDLKLDDSAFWNGSYLLDGVVDQNGFSRETITINARLTPPKGGQPLLFEASGSRTNLAEIINQLAARVVAALQISATAKEWNAADEAAQYFQEASWALRWGVFKEAQAAADSAWALGQRDLACALVRGRACLMEAEALAVRYQLGHSTLSSGYDANGKPNGPTPSDNQVRQEIKRLTAQHPLLAAFDVSEVNSAKDIAYVFADRLPTVENMDCVLHALNLYEEFSRNSPDGEPKVLSRGKGWNDWHNSDWYQLGLDNLVAASKVLQAFCLVPGAQKNNSDKLAELRGRVRTVAERISQSPSVHDSFFVGQRVANHDELAHTIEEGRNIFACMVNWGCFWQEKPEAGVALYRQLLGSPVFCYLHGEFWKRDLLQPRLVAWNDEDRQHIPQTWGNFVGELNQSSNLLWRLEAQALALLKIRDEAKLGAAFTNFFETIVTNRAELVANSVEVLGNWDGAALIAGDTQSSLFSETRDSLERVYYSNYRLRLEEMNQEYWRKTVPAQGLLQVLDRQKDYLKSNGPYKFQEFVTMFEDRDYSPEQAREILPLVVAYKSNLAAQLQTASGIQKGQLMGAIAQVGFLENDVNRILHPPTPPTQPIQPMAKPAPPAAPVVVAQPAKPTAAPKDKAETVTNAILVKKFLEIPLDGLSGDTITEVTITAHHWQAGKLVLDLQYGAQIYSFDEKGKWNGTRGATIPAIAVLDAGTERWQVIQCPEARFEVRNNFYHHTTLWRGEVFTSEGGKVCKYEATKKAWQNLDIPDVGNCELFTVNDRLYAATQNLIVEILDGGGTRILASNRRQPPVSALDTENLGTPALFAGPEKTLRVATAKKIFSEDGTNWIEICAMPQAPRPPAISDDNVLFFGDGWNSGAGVWRMPVGGSQVEFCLGQERDVDRLSINSRPSIKPKPLWKLPPGLSLARPPAGSRGTDLFLLSDHAKLQDIVDEKQHVITSKKILPQDGYHAALFCFATNFSAPMSLFLKFEDIDGAAPPVTGEKSLGGFTPPGMPTGWLCFGSGWLLLGLEFPDRIPSGGSIMNRPKTGVWVISLSELEPAIAKQKQDLMIEQQKAIAKVSEGKSLDDQRRKAFLLKHDRNHNGTIDPDEQEAAMDDPYFIKYRLEQIHAQKRQ